MVEFSRLKDSIWKDELDEALSGELEIIKLSQIMEWDGKATFIASFHTGIEVENDKIKLF